MDPIMKLLEEDEDDTLHSGAAVEAFTAALNRDIEGNTSVSHSASEAQGGNQMSSLYSQWQPHTQDGTGNVQRHTDMMCVDQQEAKHSGELDVKPYISGSESRQQEASAPHVPNELLLPKTQDNDNNNDKKEEQKRDGQIGTWISETTCRIHMVNRYLDNLFFAPPESCC